MMVCSFCGHEDCHEAEHIDAVSFKEKYPYAAIIASCEEAALAAKGIDALFDEAKRRPEGFAVGATMVPDPDAQTFFRGYRHYTVAEVHAIIDAKIEVYGASDYDETKAINVLALLKEKFKEDA